jgi:hypothetical protein
VADFDSLISSLQSNLVDIKDTIISTSTSISDQIGTVETQITDIRTDVDTQVDRVEMYENYRRIGFICLFVFPIITLPLIICGLAYKRTHGNNLFTAAIYLSYLYIFATLLVFAIHIPFTTLSADLCVYGNAYEDTTLKDNAAACAIDGSGSNCDIYKFVCLLF